MEGKHAANPSVAPFQFLSECVFLRAQKTVREVCGSERAAVALPYNEPLRWGCHYKDRQCQLCLLPTEGAWAWVACVDLKNFSRTCCISWNHLFVIAFEHRLIISGG